MAIEAESMFVLLRQTVDPASAATIEGLVAEAPDHKLVRINVVALATQQHLDEERTIAAFLHAAKIGIFDMSWNVLCPSCGSVLDSNTTLRTIRSEDYFCADCGEGYEPTLDEMVEVTFTVSPRVRRVAAHNPDQLSPLEYLRQISFGTHLDIPANFESFFDEIALEFAGAAPRRTGDHILANAFRTFLHRGPRNSFCSVPRYQGGTYKRKTTSAVHN